MPVERGVIPQPLLCCPFIREAGKNPPLCANDVGVDGVEGSPPSCVRDSDCTNPSPQDEDHALDVDVHRIPSPARALLIQKRTVVRLLRLSSFRVTYRRYCQ